MTYRQTPTPPLGSSAHNSKIMNRWIFFAALMLLMAALPIAALAGLKPLNEAEMKAATGGGAVDFDIIENTARVYFDVHIETYAEIDSVKLGYYERHDFDTRKFLAPEDPMVKMGADEKTFQLWNYINGSNPANGSVPAGKVRHDWGALPDTYVNAPSWTGYGPDAYFDFWSVFHPGTPTGYTATTPFNSYIYTESDGVTKHYIPYTVNSNYQTKYNDTIDGKYIEGLEGKNNYNGLLKTLTGVDYFSTYPSANNNVYDWDINIENLRLGKEPGNPMVIDGLVLMLKYDDITSPNKKLTEIIIGSNCLEGDLYGDMYRMTGFLSAKLPQAARNSLLEGTGEFSKVFNEAPVPVCMIRDSFLYLVDHYRFEYYDPEPGLDDKLYPPIVEDPTSNNIHTGAFLRMGLDPASQNFGFSLIMGYNEIIANAASPTEFIHQSLRTWWD